MRLAFSALVCGAALGMIFFAGLWWTIRCALGTANPALWIAGSLSLRVSFVLVGFYALAAEGWQAMTLCLLGFLLSRIAVTLFARPALTSQHAS